MKFKFILGLATATMFLATSCSQEEFTTPVSTGDEGTISLAVNVPDGIQSRAFGDGTTVDQLQYALYKYDDKNKNYTLVDDEIVSQFSGTYNLQLKLPTGFTYKLVFWADNSEIICGNSPVYTVTFNENEAKMQLYGSNGAISANDERADAFFAYYDFTVNGDLTGTIELKRPFAQINFGTNDLKDYLNAIGYNKENGYFRTDLCVYGESLPNTLNLMTGEVDGNISSVFFNSYPLPQNETFPVKGDYEYLAMAYLLIGKDDQELVSVELKYDGSESGRTVKNVPVRRNYRTNIYGQVLTSNLDLNVVVAPAFDGTLEPNPLEIVAGAGGSVTLTDDLALDKVVTFTQDAIVDLNGKTVTSVEGKDGAFTVLGSTLVIKGDGTMESIDDEHCTLVWADKGGTVIIEDGTFTANGNDDQLIYIGPEGGTIYINGGTFKINDDPNFTLNCYDTAYRNGKAKFVVSGGKFYKFDPADSSADYIGKENANWLAPGYKSEKMIIDGEEWYVVVPDDTIVLDPDSDNSNLASKISEILNRDDVTEATVLLTEGEFKMKTGTSTTFTWPENKKITFVGLGKDKTVISNADETSAPGCEVVLSDLTYKIFENPTNHTSFGFKGASKVDITNCDIYGEFHAYTGDVTIKDSNFYFAGAGGAANGTIYGLYIETDGKTVIDGCTFDTSSPDKNRETKGILVFSYQGNVEFGDIEVNNCEFIVTGKESTKAAIEIHSEKINKAGTLRINNTTYTPGGYIALWREIQGAQQYFTVYVDGMQVPNEKQ